MEIKTFLRANWDRTLAVLLAIAGVVLLVVGWFGVSGTGLVAEQNPYLISAGLGGVALLALGCTTWLSADIQDEWRRLDHIEEHLATLARESESSATDTEIEIVPATTITNGTGAQPARRSRSRTSRVNEPGRAKVSAEAPGTKTRPTPDDSR